MTKTPLLTTGTPHICTICQKELPSKNALFKHLKSVAYHSDNTTVARLSLPQDKIAVLYGYCPSLLQHVRVVRDKGDTTSSNDTKFLLQGGDHVARVVMQAVQEMENDLRSEVKLLPNSSGVNNATININMCNIKATAAVNDGSTINRSFGTITRGSSVVAQDEGTGAVTEVLCAKASPLFVPGDGDDNKDGDNDDSKAAREDEAIKEWTAGVNEKVQKILQQDEGVVDSSSLLFGGNIVVFGRLKMPAKFNPESDTTTRRMSYLLPVDFLVSESSPFSLEDLMAFLPVFEGGFNSKSINRRAGKANEIVMYLFRIKKLLKKLMTLVIELDPNDKAAVFEKQLNARKKRRSKSKSKRADNTGTTTQQQGTRMRKNEGIISSSDGAEEVGLSRGDGRRDELVVDDFATKHQEDESSSKDREEPVEHVLRRKRYHNFTADVMAHEYLAFRRVDRFYHRATTQINSVADNNLERKFMELSVTADMFLTGQVERMVGLFLAVARGLIDEDICECVFDEEYSPLVPTPPAPRFALFAESSQYMTWEGKTKMILNPRPSKTVFSGWSDPNLIDSVNKWKASLEKTIAQVWLRDGVDDTDRLVSEKNWTTDVLEPWAQSARVQLEDWRKWREAKKNASTSDSLIASTLLPSIDSIDKSIPELYEWTLRCLRDADASGLWPTTTPKRKLVMVSKDDKTCLSSALMKAKQNKEKRECAYSFSEGQGGASGSFSIGAMPGGGCVQPKGNELFPELVEAAFRLEIALCPNREPSSTIAVNRNAQFRPHTDNGAGAGQSRSLIVGLGDYVGGELVVEGTKHDIRYNKVEFNGWEERHWTLPFLGERFSLVWFTPRGCEGVRGIDLI